MMKHSPSRFVLAVALAAAGSAAHAVDTKDAARARAATDTRAKPAAAKPAPPATTRSLQSIDYENLRDKVGRDIIVRTSNGTRREGKLLKYSGASLQVKLVGRDGGIELDIPRAQAVSIDLVTDSISSVEGDRAQTK